MSRLVAALIVLASTPAFAVPLVITQQGRLLDANDQPVSGVHRLTASLFTHGVNDPASPETPLWSATFQTTFDANGLYQIELGDTAVSGMTALDASMFTSGDGADVRFLELAIDGTTLAPRLRVGSAPFALVAHSLDGGSVNASQLAVQGRTVVDGNGEWQGGFTTFDARYAKTTDLSSGTVSVPWSALTGVPQLVQAGSGLALDDAGRLDVNAGTALEIGADNRVSVMVGEGLDVGADGSLGVDFTKVASAGDYLKTDGSKPMTGTLSGIGASFSGSIGAASANVSGTLTAGALTTSGAISAASLTTSGSIGAASADVTGTLTAGALTTSGSIDAASADVTGTLTAGALSTTGSIGAASANLTGALTAGSVASPEVTASTLTLSSTGGPMTLDSGAGIVLTPQASAPPNPVTGMIYFDAARGPLFYFGGAWQQFATTSQSCETIKLANAQAASGVYTITPSGSAPVQVYCDMTTDGGGWTRVANIRAEIPICSLVGPIGATTDVSSDTGSTGVLALSIAGSIPMPSRELLVVEPSARAMFGSTNSAFTWANIASGVINSANVSSYGVTISVNGGAAAPVVNSGGCTQTGNCLLAGDSSATGNDWTPIIGIGAFQRGSYTQDATCLSVSSGYLGIYSGRLGSSQSWGTRGYLYVR